MSTYGRLLLTFCDENLQVKWWLLKTMFGDQDLDKMQEVAKAIGVEIVL